MRAPSPADRVVLLVLAVATALAARPTARALPDLSDADAILGRWLNGKGVAIIEIYEADGHYMGKVVWLKEGTYPADDPKDMAGRERVDRENPDPALRGRPILGLVIMRGFAFDGTNSWSKGRVYDPEHGKEYRGRMTLTAPDTLSLRGYVGISLFGRTERWTRARQPGASGTHSVDDGTACPLGAAAVALRGGVNRGASPSGTIVNRRKYWE